MNAPRPIREVLTEQLRCEHDFATTLTLELRCTICGLVKEGPKP